MKTITKNPGELAPGRYKDKHSGLQLHVSKSGTLRAWRVRVRPKGGEPVWHSIGYYPELSLESAREAAMVAHGRIKRHANVKATMPNSPCTFNEAVELYIKSPMVTTGKKTKVTEVYKDGMRRALQRPIHRDDHLALIRNRLLSEIQDTDLVRLKDQGVPIEMLRKLKVFFHWCATRGVAGLKESPVKNVELPATGEDNRVLISCNEKGVIDWSELHSVLAALKIFEEKNPKSPWPALYRLSILTGIRPDEARRLKWEDVKELDGEFPLLNIEGKTGRRKHPLSYTAAKLLMQWQPDATKRQGWLFPGEGEGQLLNAGRVHQQIVKMSKLKPWARKHLRKTVRTYFGFTLRDELGRLLLGHSLKGIDKNYDKSDKTPKVREAVNEWAAQVQKLITPPPVVVKKPSKVVSIAA